MMASASLMWTQKEQQTLYCRHPDTPKTLSTSIHAKNNRAVDELVKISLNQELDRKLTSITLDSPSGRRTSFSGSVHDFYPNTEKSKTKKFDRSKRRAGFSGNGSVLAREWIVLSKAETEARKNRQQIGGASR